MVDKPAFKMGDYVEKISGSSWRGRVVGTYATDLTPEGYAVESDTEKGSVQIYPAKALRLATPANGEQVERVAKAIHGVINTDDMPETGWAGLMGQAARAAIAATLSTPTEEARSRVKVLEEAARPIVAKLEHSEASFARYRAVHPYEDDINGDDGVCVSVADLRALRTALGNKETDRHG